MKKLLISCLISLTPASAAMAQALNAENFSTDYFTSYLQCVGCHQSNPEGDTGTDIGAPTSWLPSMMSNAFRDPLWQAKVETEMNRNPKLRDVIDQKCLGCHAPIAKTEAKLAKEEIRIFDYNGVKGLNNPENPRYFQAMEGITCTTCHQMKFDGELERKEYSGGWDIELENKRPSLDRKLYGNIEDPTHGIEYNMAGFGAEYSTGISRSEACGVCHEIRTPVVDINTTEVIPGAEFVEQSTYTEWMNSDFSENKDNITCQDCHMPAQDNVSIGGNPPRNNFHVHSFRGSNISMIDMFRRNPVELGIGDTYTTANFDLAIEQTRDFLQNDTADLTVQSQGIVDGALEVALKVENKAGHKFPTGIQARRAWVHFEVKDANGDTVFESGHMNEDGSVVGSDSDLNGAIVEPHYDVIDSEEQVLIYEGIMADVNSDPTFTILFANGYAKDNRLLPKGYVEHPETKVYGEATNDSNFVGGSDVITYRVNDLPDGNYTVTAKLMFQMLGKPFMNDLFVDTTPAVIRFKNLYDQPELIQAQEMQSVTIDINK